MSELKPCPFCGAKGVIIDLSHPRNPDVETYHVDCLADCDMGMGQYKTREDAIAAWNTRASDARIAELEADVERLRGLLKQQPGALVIAYEDGDHQRLARATFAAIARAEAAEAEVERLKAGPKVKPLEWLEYERGPGFYAHSFLGRYSAWEQSGVGHWNAQGIITQTVPGGLEAAKAAAQADYEARILSALVQP